jgi:hypothetical protein
MISKKISIKTILKRKAFVTIGGKTGIGDSTKENKNIVAVRQKQQTNPSAVRSFVSSHSRFVGTF